MTDFYLSCGVSGLTILGMMGEAPKLEPAEALAIAKQVVRRANVPVVVGVSAPGFAAMRSLARGVMDAGAAGVMIAPPPPCAPTTRSSATSRRRWRHRHRYSVGAAGLSLVLTVVMTPKVIRQIVMDNPSCVMLKHEDWPGLEKISALRGFQREGSLRPLSIYAAMAAVPGLRNGTRRGGAMTGYAFPDMLVDVVRLSQAGERDAAHDSSTRICR